MSNYNSSLTPNQRDHLRMLLAAGAFDRATGATIFHPACRRLNANVVGILTQKGFTEGRVRATAPGGSRCMHYWLTEGGAALARRILQGDV